MNNRNYLSLLLALLVAVGQPALAKHDLKGDGLYFVENKGQVKDQNSKPRGDIQFSMRAPGLNIFIGNGQIHYQFSKTELTPRQQPEDYRTDKNDISCMQASVQTYRLDVELLNANVNAAIVKQDLQAYYENYYLAGGPDNGIVAHTYKKIIYRNVYPGIDWIISLKGANLEHEFLVGPNGDASKIKLKYSGHSSLKLNEDGSITATTPMGVINEQAPVSYRLDGKKIASSFKLEGDILTYDLKGYKGAVLIDPILNWGTYYGPDTSSSPFYTVATHAKSVYACGLAWSKDNIATSGAYLATFAGGSTDGYLVKFDTSGARLWATYYGGPGDDWAMGAGCDENGNIYIGGNTNSTSGIATAGCQQPTYGGGMWDGFVAKFNESGSRKWGTYLGGTSVNYLYTVSCDNLGNLYACGETSDNNNISTAGAYQPAKAGGWDVFLVQYDTLGVRQWGTYVGGPGNEFAGVHATSDNSVYVAGWTTSTTGISTPPNIHQASLSGTADIFVMRLHPWGARAWGSYYGGPGSEGTGGLTCDKLGNIYLFGSTSSSTGIASTGTAQTSFAGGIYDAFINKLEMEHGYRVWGTYVGGTGDETVTYSRITTDDSLRVCIAGITTSGSGFATADAWQPAYGGGDNDAFIAIYDTAGGKLWSTFYGGSGKDEARGCAFSDRALYVCGQTTSPSQIATPGGFLPTGGSSTSGWNFQGFVARFLDTTAIPEVIDTSTTDTTLVATTVGQDGGNIRISPNPNAGSFAITGSLNGQSNGAVLFTVSNVAGQIVARGEVTVRNGKLNKQIAIDENLPTGVYMLKIEAKERSYMLKFLKE